ncbi:hypothetical protein [Streptacidiphilus sp. EB129]|uniref:hypothetical protein n=1 Tax=Streptacidiphilus sp. EB129 TaxID=3156262 RepID=UPI0035158629
MTEIEPERFYDPRDAGHLAWWKESVRQQVAAAMGLPEGVTLGWDGEILPRRRCESEACDEYDGIHCYGDGCAMVRKED